MEKNMKKSIIYTSLILLAASLSPALAMEGEDREAPSQRNYKAQNNLQITFVGDFENHGNIEAPILKLKNPNGLVNLGIIEAPNGAID